jgi:hypothetical protein
VSRLSLLLMLALSGCASRRVLKLENALLEQRTTTLEQQVAELEAGRPDPADYERSPDLETVDRYLERAGFVHTWNKTGNGHIRMEFAGHNANFAVTIQHFPSAGVLFMATSDYLHLADAQSIESVVVLLVQLAAINYDLLLGKFQLNPETGEILLSTELQLGDGLGYHTFVDALDHLCQTADARYPDLKHAIEGLGL